MPCDGLLLATLLACVCSAAHARPQSADKEDMKLAMMLSKLLAKSSSDLASPEPSDWSECSVYCGVGGHRTTDVRPNWSVPCNWYDCSDVSRTCRPVDIVFVLERAQSLLEPNFWVSKQVAGEIVDFMTSYHSDLRLGVVSFDHTVAVHAHLRDHRAPTAEDLWAIPYAPGGTGSVMGDALITTMDMLMAYKEEGREQIVIIISDGLSSQKQLTESILSDLLMQTTVFSLGLKSDEGDADTFASDTDKFYAYYGVYHSILGVFEDDVMNYVCPQA